MPSMTDRPPNAAHEAVGAAAQDFAAAFSVHDIAAAAAFFASDAMLKLLDQPAVSGRDAIALALAEGIETAGLGLLEIHTATVQPTTTAGRVREMGVFTVDSTTGDGFTLIERTYTITWDTTDERGPRIVFARFD